MAISLLQTKRNMSYWHQKPREGAIKKNIYSFLINLERKKIYKRCELRFDKMLEKGALEEVKKIHDSNIDRSLPVAKSLGVKWLLSYLDKKMSLEEAISFIKNQGFEVIYGDTDSVFISLNSGLWGNINQLGNQLVEKTNTHLLKKIKREFKVDSLLDL